jgi:hypothetical protein
LRDFTLACVSDIKKSRPEKDSSYEVLDGTMMQLNTSWLVGQ